MEQLASFSFSVGSNSATISQSEGGLYLVTVTGACTDICFECQDRQDAEIKLREVLGVLPSVRHGRRPRRRRMMR